MGHHFSVATYNNVRSASLDGERGEGRGRFLGEDSGHAQGTFVRLFGMKRLPLHSASGSRSAPSFPPPDAECLREGVPGAGLKADLLAI